MSLASSRSQTIVRIADEAIRQRRPSHEIAALLNPIVHRLEFSPASSEPPSSVIAFYLDDDGIEVFVEIAPFESILHLQCTGMTELPRSATKTNVADWIRERGG